MLVLRLQQYIKKVGANVIEILGKPSVPVKMDNESKFDDNGGLTTSHGQLLMLIEAHSQTDCTTDPTRTHIR